MKFGPIFKSIFWPVVLALYFSGLATWILQNWFWSPTEYGDQPRTEAATLLHLHGVVGLAFIGVFGYLLRAHVETGLKERMKVKSGVAMLLGLSLVLLTVPGLYYLVDESFKHLASVLHTYLGLFLFLPLILHLSKRAW